MNLTKNLLAVISLMMLSIGFCSAQPLEQRWQTPTVESRPLVFWYWMQGAISKAGITADLEAMHEAGIAGACLTPVKGVPEKPFIEPAIEQLSPEWWDMVNFTFKEADRLGLKITFHICDGFALAGGPWITPELSMQKIVWSQQNINSEEPFSSRLPQPESYQGYYKDIAIFAYPTPDGAGVSTENVKPRVTVSEPGIDASFLVDDESSETLRCEERGWIVYEFAKPFPCRSIRIEGANRNFQSQRFAIEASDDGINYVKVRQLEPPRQGWQNEDAPMTHSIPTTTARYFRFAYNREGTEPGAEDIDAAKWRQTLRVKKIHLYSEARLHQYEGKSGAVWRVSPRTTSHQIPAALCVNPQEMIDISAFVDKNGELSWNVPDGKWTILRIGHTSTGHTNATGGKGAGLECDKFNPEAIRLQFNSWFGKAVDMAGPELTKRVVDHLYIDSWECGSQNWSPVFREEFKQRRGYDIYPYLPVMAGIPIESIETSERVLYDVRQTISELVVDKFFTVMRDEGRKKGCSFMAENVAPTMTSDGLMHFKHVDIPMAEFWLESPTHDKPNDLLDVISGAHIYGKNIIQAEAFTQLRTMFTEHPGMLKTLQDRQYAAGINRLAYHVYVQNPWLDRQPGMTLDGIGLYFQRDQTWWKPGRAWVDYAQRCQALLQYGHPVIDLAVFTGEELPRRSVLPDRLVPFLPGIFGEERVKEEKKRMRNKGNPTRVMPVGVNHSANMAYPEDWVNSLRGYQYDGFNPDVLLQAQVVDGRIVLPGGASYATLILPGKHQMQPNPEYMSAEVTAALTKLIQDGATVLADNVFLQVPIDGKGRLLRLPYRQETFDRIGLQRDFIATDASGAYAKSVAYNHRQGEGTDIYFVSNQLEEARTLQLSLRVSGRQPELWNPVTGEIRDARQWSQVNGRTELSLQLDAAESVFIVLRRPTAQTSVSNGQNHVETKTLQSISTPWKVQFDIASRGPKEAVTFNTLSAWNEHQDERIRHYSGTAVYQNTFSITKESTGKRLFLELENVYNMADVKVNGISCGIIWTKPYRVDITNAVKGGQNSLEVAVTNTWANRMMGDEDFATDQYEEKDRIWTNARYRLRDKVLVDSGLVGDVRIVEEK